MSESRRTFDADQLALALSRFASSLLNADSDELRYAASELYEATRQEYWPGEFSVPDGGHGGKERLPEVGGGASGEPPAHSGAPAERTT